MAIYRWGKRVDAFEFGHTCPVIDEGLAAIDELVWRVLEYSGIPGVDVLSDKVSAAIAEHIEKVRQTNVSMRAAAEERITELCNDKENLEDKVKDLEKENQRLQGIIDNYED